MYELVFLSPVNTPTSVSIREKANGAFGTLEEAQSAKSQIIREALARWAEDETGSPFWAIGPSGKRYDPPAWAAEYGYQFYDPALEYGHSHYFAVRELCQ